VSGLTKPVLFVVIRSNQSLTDYQGGKNASKPDGYNDKSIKIKDDSCEVSKKSESSSKRSKFYKSKSSPSSNTKGLKKASTTVSK